MGTTLHTLLKKIDVTVADGVADLKIEKIPEWWQEEAIFRSLTEDGHRFGNYDQPGVGKTLPLQVAILVHAMVGNKVCIMMPPTLLTQFFRSMKDDFPGFSDVVSLHILNNPPSARERLYEKWNETGEWPDLLGMSYQMFEKVFHIKADKKKKTQKRGELADFLEPAGYCVLAADEAQKLKNPTSSISRCIKRFLLQEGGAAFLPATGTPAHNTTSDFYGLTRFLSPTAYKDLDDFQEKHEVAIVDARGKRQVVSYQNLELLHRNVYMHARRVQKHEVMDLSEPQVIPIDIELHERHYRTYKQVIDQRWAEVGGEVLDLTKDQAMRMAALRAVTNPRFVTDDVFENVALETLLELIDDLGIGGQLLDDNGLPVIGTSEKLVVFVYFRETVKFLQEALEAYNPALVYGGVSGTLRDKHIERFLTDPKCSIMIANYESGGVGLNLQDVCRYAYFYETIGVPGTFQQALERIWRKGQLRQVSAWVAKYLRTLSPNALANMMRKHGESNQVTRDVKTLFSQLHGSV